MHLFDAENLSKGIPAFVGIFAFPLAVGAVSSVSHCAAMCGPIHLFLARHGNGRGLWLYHTGRVITYGFLGALVGLLGWAFNARGIGWVWIALYVLMGLKFLGVPLWPSSWESRYGNWILMRIRPLTAPGNSSRPAFLFLPLGLAAGFLPCVTTQAGLAWAAGTSSISTGAGGMLLLGAGTLPVFLAWPRKWFPGKGKLYHVILGVGMLALAAWRAYGLLFAQHSLGPVSCP